MNIIYIFHFPLFVLSFHSFCLSCKWKDEREKTYRDYYYCCCCVVRINFQVLLISRLCLMVLQLLLLLLYLLSSSLLQLSLSSLLYYMCAVYIFIYLFLWGLCLINWNGSCVCTNFYVVCQLIYICICVYINTCILIYVWKICV